MCSFEQGRAVKSAGMAIILRAACLVRNVGDANVAVEELPDQAFFLGFTYSGIMAPVLRGRYTEAAGFGQQSHAHTQC